MTIAQKDPAPRKKRALIKKSGSDKLLSAKALDTIGSEARLAALIEEAEAELAVIESRIEKLEAQLAQLSDLKIQRQKLLTFKLSLQAINKNYASLDNNVTASNYNINTSTFGEASKSTVAPALFPKPSRFLLKTSDENFDADEAIRQAKRLVRISSLNFQLFQALVAYGGAADTPAIKQHLLTRDVRQPGSGESFEVVPLTSISSRMNYLVRKGLAEGDGRGGFRSLLGWKQG
jgi:hypothetical protein